ncbi:MAG: polysaccharide biosynthesis C-terminal domain-containing protein [Clostridia bacterium]|nr:polysaccharide biosynthesis C-terminal domain-containing protein [Clostridia bacterium]
MLRSMGDSRSTLVAQVVGGLLNVAADWLFIARLDLGVAGAAWATLISQTVSAAYVVLRLTRLEGPHALRLKNVRFDKSVLSGTVTIGVPAGVQALVITLSNVAAQYHINRLGESAIAAFTAYFKVELLVYYPIVALGQAMMTFAGQNIGANRPERVRRGLRECLALGVGVSVVMSAVGLTFGHALFRLFYADEAAIALGLRILSTTFPFYFAYCFFTDSRRRHARPGGIPAAHADRHIQPVPGAHRAAVSDRAALAGRARHRPVLPRHLGRHRRVYAPLLAEDAPVYVTILLKTIRKTADSGQRFAGLL